MNSSIANQVEKQSTSQNSEKSSLDYYSSTVSKIKDKIVPHSIQENFGRIKEIGSLVQPFAQSIIIGKMDEYIFSSKPVEIGYQWSEIKRDRLLNDYCGIFYAEYRHMDAVTYDQIMEYINHLIHSYYHIWNHQHELPDMILQKNNEKLIQTFKYIMNYFLLFDKKVKHYCEYQKYLLDQYTKQYYKQYSENIHDKDNLHFSNKKLDELMQNYIESKNRANHFKELAQTICTIMSRYRFSFYDSDESDEES